GRPVVVDGRPAAHGQVGAGADPGDAAPPQPHQAEPVGPVIQLGLHPGGHVRGLDGKAVHDAGDLRGASRHQGGHPGAAGAGALGREVVRLELRLVPPEVLDQPGEEAHAGVPPSWFGAPPDAPWAASAALRGAARRAKASTTGFGGVSASTSRGGRGSSPRTTTTSRITLTSGAMVVWSTAAGPWTTARRNQRGPSTPMNRAGWIATRPSGARPGRRHSSSVPKNPSTISALPPVLRTPSAISRRMSSQSPLERGAAKACSWRFEPAMPQVTPTTRPVSFSTSRRSSMPRTAGTRSAPRSTRPSMSGRSETSYGPSNRRSQSRSTP